MTALQPPLLAPPDPRDRVPECPYVGLVPFDEAHEGYFFGRERERDLIMANLIASRFTILYAPSGVGKSSVLRAGVVPEHRRRAEESCDDFGAAGVAVAYVSDWSGPASEMIARTILHALAQTPGASRVAPRHTVGFDLPWLRDVVQQSEVEGIHLILDQFEEYFLYHEEGRSSDLIDALGEVLSAQDVRVNVLLAIREDALATLDRFKGRVPRLFDNYLRLAPLDRRAGKMAIEGPLRRYERLVPTGERLTIEPELVETLLDQVQVGRLAPVPEAVADGPGGGAPAGEGTGQIEAPYLQLVLTRLWEEERRAGSRTLRQATLDGLGGAETLVRTHLDQVIAELTPEQTDVAASVFHHLVTSSGSKIALTAGDLAEWSGLDVEPVRDLLDTLSAGRQRILRPVPPPFGHPGEPRFEIYHDVMGAAVLDWRRRYLTAREHEQADQQLVHEKEHALAAATDARRRLRRVSLIAVAMGFTVLVMAGLGVVLYFRDREAKQQRLLAEAAAALESDPGRSLDKAVAAYDIDGDADAREAVLEAASAPRGTMLWDGTTPAVDIEVTPDGRYIAAFDQDGGVHVFGADGSVEAEASIDGLEGSVVDGVIGADTSRAVVLTDRGMAALVDLETGRSTALAHEGVESVALVDSGPRPYVVLSLIDANTRVYDATTADLVRALPQTSFQAVGTPDGEHVVTSDSESGGRMRVWELPTGNLVADTGALAGYAVGLQTAGRSIVAVTYQEDGIDRHAIVWDWEAKSEPVTFPVGGWGDLRSVWVAPEGDLLVVAIDKATWAYQLSTGTLAFAGRDLADWTDESRPSSDGRWIVTAAADGRVLVWSADGSEHPTYEFRGHRGDILLASFVDDDQAIVSLGLDGTVRRWELPSVPREESHGNWVLGMDRSGDGELLVTQSRDMTAQVLTVDGLDHVATLELGYIPQRVRFDPTDPHRVFVIPEYGSAPVLWRWNDTGSVESVSPFDGISQSAATLLSMDVSSDGAVLAAGDDYGRVHRWDAKTGRLLQEDDAYHVPAAAPIWDVAFDPTDDRIAAATLDGVWLWSVADPTEPLVVDTDNAMAVVFDDRGDRFAVASRGGTLDVWNLQGRLLRRMVTHGSNIGRPAFSGDGGLLAVGTAEGGIEVGDVDSGRTVMLSRVHGDSVNDVMFMPDDDGRIVSVSDDTTVAASSCQACTDPDQVIDVTRNWVREHR